MSVSPVLCPLPIGERRLIDILEDHTRESIELRGFTQVVIVLVDHGSPFPEVTAVREWLGSGLARRFVGQTRVTQAVMERRKGRQYDFNGELLENVIAAIGSEGRSSRIVLAMQFISPGRHAGERGDIANIIQRAMHHHPHVEVAASRLVSEHPVFADILWDRLNSVSVYYH
ncbi:MAG: CbiX/SirB N-terminal domain-containing protein [Thiohalocapsa sp.]